MAPFKPHQAVAFDFKPSAIVITRIVTEIPPSLSTDLSSIGGLSDFRNFFRSSQKSSHWSGGEIWSPISASGNANCEANESNYNADHKNTTQLGRRVGKRQKVEKLGYEDENHKQAHTCQPENSCE